MQNPNPFNARAIERLSKAGIDVSALLLCAQTQAQSSTSLVDPWDKNTSAFLAWAQGLDFFDLALVDFLDEVKSDVTPGIQPTDGKGGASSVDLDTIDMFSEPPRASNRYTLWDMPSKGLIVADVLDCCPVPDLNGHCGMRSFYLFRRDGAMSLTMAKNFVLSLKK